MQLLDYSVNYSRDLSLKELPANFLLHNNVVSEIVTPQLSPRPFRFSIKKKYYQNDLRLPAYTYYNSLMRSPIGLLVPDSSVIPLVTKSSTETIYFWSFLIYPSSPLKVLCRIQHSAELPIVIA